MKIVKLKNVIGRAAAVCTAVTLTICGACLAAKRAEQGALQVTSTAGSRQVMILDAGHGAYSENRVFLRKYTRMGGCTF